MFRRRPEAGVDRDDITAIMEFLMRMDAKLEETLWHLRDEGDDGEELDT